MKKQIFSQTTVEKSRISMWINSKVIITARNRYETKELSLRYTYAST